MKFCMRLTPLTCILLLLGALQLGAAKKKTDHYKTLGIKKDATQKDIKKAYRKLSLLLHPDKNIGDPNAQDKFTAVNSAYDVLGDADTRAIYDDYGDNDEKMNNSWQYNQRKRKGKVPKEGVSFYMHAEDITQINIKNYEKFVSKGIKIVQFYAPWCSHCQDHVKDYKKAAVLLDEIAELGAVNCVAERRLCNQMGISSYPTLKLYLWEKQKEIVDYQGEIDTERLYQFVDMYRNPSHVELDFMNWQEEVLDSTDLWLVDFSAGEWCGPCTMVKKYVVESAYRMKAVAKVGIVDCDENRNFCSENGISAYPTIKMYGSGKKQEGTTGEVLEFPRMGFGHPAEGALKFFEKVSLMVLRGYQTRQKLLLTEEQIKQQIKRIYKLYKTNPTKELYRNALADFEGQEDVLLYALAKKWELDIEEIKEEAQDWVDESKDDWDDEDEDKDEL